MTPHPYSVRRTSLADGRDLLFFDDSEPFVSGEQNRETVDPRNLPTPEYHSEMRRDPLTGKWVVYAAHRMNRTFMPPANENPLAPTRPGQTPTEVPAEDYDVVVFENRFPSLAEEARLGSEEVRLSGDRSFVPRVPAQGRCEVVCFTSDPDKSFRELSVPRVRTVIETWTHRTAELKKMSSVKAVFPFENRGEEIGVTLQHPHGQIYAYPFIPPHLESMVDRCRTHHDGTGRDLFDDLIAAEHESGQRLISTGTYFSTVVPPAARWPLEVMIVPHRAVRDFTELSDPEKEELATTYLDLLGRVDRFFPGVERTPYIAAWNQAPVGASLHDMRLHLNLFSLMRSPHRMKFLAGSESGMGAWVNDTTPEKIAQRLREIA